MTAPWLDDRKPPDVKKLTIEELLELWSSCRNGMIGLMAAEEVCRRLMQEKCA